MAIRQLTILISLGLASICSLGCQAPSEESGSSSSTAAAEVSEATTILVADEEAETEAEAEEEVEVEEEAAPETLGIGDPAPPLAIAKWVNGEAVDGFEDGRVYVVEFWATWCGPCRMGMPHMAELQEKLRDDVTIIGITREGEEKVSKFFEEVQDQESGKTWEEVLTYTIALDEESQTNDSYMRAAGQNGIPCAFIVGKDGIVEWIGHPASMDDVLASIVEGSYDRAKAIQEFADRQALQLLMRDISPLVRSGKQSGDFTDAYKMLDDAIENGVSKSAVEKLRVSVAAFADDHELVNELIAKMYKDYWEDGNQLNEFAWRLATRPEGSQNLELAMEIAMRANELTGGSNASTLDTIARVYYEMGNLEEAVAWQTKAVEVTPHPSLKRSLEKYKSELEGDDDDSEEEEEEEEETADAS